MKIENGNSAVELSSYLQQVRQQRATAGYEQQAVQQGAETDRVNLSDRAREVQQASRTLTAMPDVRDEKVAEVKLEVDRGTYNVNGEQVATAMLRESMENNLVLQSIDMRV